MCLRHAGGMTVVQALGREGREWLTLRKDWGPAPGAGKYILPSLGVGGGKSTLTLRAYMSPSVRWILLPLESHEGDEGEEGSSSTSKLSEEDEEEVLSCSTLSSVASRALSARKFRRGYLAVLPLLDL